jgi:hypothetical protein
MDNKKTAKPNKLPMEYFGSSLMEIGWQLTLTIVVPLWAVSVYRNKWLDNTWFGIGVMIWIAFIFSSIVYVQMKKIPKKYGGLGD